jgi:branched-chain amino acid transport system permease protein
MIYQQLINGLMLGASYCLVAVGYTLIFGVLNLLYFAHGEVFMVGAFVGLFLVLYTGRRPQELSRRCRQVSRRACW